MSESSGFRNNLEKYFDMARNEPVAINKNDESYILLHESEYLKMMEEISNLQKGLISALQVQNGQYTVINPSEEGEQFLDDYLKRKL